MKGLFRRGGTWHFRYQSHGQQVRVSMGTKDERTAIEHAERLLRTPQDRDRRAWELELKAYLKDRVAQHKMSQNAADSRVVVLLKFARDHSVSTPRDVTQAHVKSWYKALQKDVVEETAQTYVRWLGTFLKYLDGRGKVVHRIGPIEMSRIRKAKRKPFCTADEVRALIEAAPDNEMRFILYCGFHAGLRRGEIAEARPEWFDLRNGLLHVQQSDTWQPKDRDDRTIPLTKEFRAFLDAYGLPSPFMLKGKTMKKERKWRYRYDFRRPFDDLMTAQKMEWVTIHTMRRTFASLKVSAGVSLYKVAVWLGDLERVVQDHYGYLIPKDSDIDRGL